MTASAKYRCQSVAVPDLRPQIRLSAGFAKHTQVPDILKVLHDDRTIFAG
jgi:hypothetical protein